MYRKAEKRGLRSRFEHGEPYPSSKGLFKFGLYEVFKIR